jgi:hypothetical protein
MIPQAYMTAWRKNAPWQEDFQVEQDMVAERALKAIYSDQYLKERLAFRGGNILVIQMIIRNQVEDSNHEFEITAMPFAHKKNFPYFLLPYPVNCKYSPRVIVQ